MWSQPCAQWSVRVADVLLPSLGADMDAGAVTQWRVTVGDEVRKGQIIAVIETDKADIEVESFQEGVVEEFLAPVGERIPVGTPLIRLGSGTTAGGLRPPTEHGPALHRASPRARRLAADRGIDLEQLAGTAGPGGQIFAADVARAAASDGGGAGSDQATVSREGREDPAAAMRRAVGQAMSRSKREIPHYYLARTVSMRAAVSWLAARNAERPVGERVLMTALIARAVALAAARVPGMNGHYVDGQFTTSAAVHLGVAVSLRGGGLVAPAIHDAHTKNLDQTMAGLRDLVARARTGTLRRAEMTEATITLTSLGEGGADAIFGVIPPPQVALVGVGGVVERPWVENGAVAALPVVTIGLSADHRVTDGLRGAAFLAQIEQHLLAPEDFA